jgi:hypothetical protein
MLRSECVLAVRVFAQRERRATRESRHKVYGYVHVPRARV